MPAHRLFGNDSEAAPRGGLRKPLSCVSCGLYKDVLSPKMEPYGRFNKKVMVVGEGPGEQEDRKGKPWQGRAGGVLKEAFEEFGFDLFEDCVSLNAVNCRPPKNRTPTPHELACCRARIVAPAIARYSPSIILLMGGSAVDSVVGSLLSDADDTIGKWRGFQIPVPEWKAWLCPTYHPSYILREEKRTEIETVWKQDIKQALRLLDVPVPEPENLRDRIILLKDDEAILRQLHRVRVRKGLFSHDYETTGIRAVAHKLVCASFCQTPDRAYAFMLDRASSSVIQAWREILLDNEIGKISHNLGFEYEWARAKFDVDEINWAWDGMLGAHVIDNRPGICGLKHQAFLNFGIPEYDSLIAPFMKSIEPKNPAAWNRIYDFIKRYGEDEALIYCGIDSLVALRLALKQMDYLNANA